MRTKIIELDEYAGIRLDLLQVEHAGEITTGVTPAGVRISFTPICAMTGRGILAELGPAAYEPAPGEITMRLAELLDALATARPNASPRLCDAHTD